MFAGSFPTTLVVTMFFVPTVRSATMRLAVPPSSGERGRNPGVAFDTDGVEDGSRPE